MNKVILMGRLVADPETRYTQNNISVSRFRLAVNRQVRQQQEGQPTADFFDIVAWRGTADFVSRYFRKGMQVLVEGYLRNNNWKDQQGNRHYRTEIHCENVFFADSKRDRDSTPSGAPSYNNTVPGPAPQDLGGMQQPDSGDGYYPFSGDDEDLPF
ncbi:MAG: single-stranded DNA-binding protein [Clostridiaceae bacterium]|jgi:single-strand DNA-binding protein|nr:single-stranded DNA-binding protein [Clostridiaceae bacterium]